MITNPDSIKNKYKCNRTVANFLIYKKGLSLLGMDEKWFYFAYTDELIEAVQNLPLLLKISEIFYDLKRDC
jgi:hypothetical protein